MKNIYELIGKISVDFESLDLLLSVMVGRLITEDPKMGAIVTSEMAFKNLVHAFSSLIKYKYPNHEEFVEEVNKLVRMLNEAEEKRNQIIHSTYGNKFENNESDSIERIKLTARQKHGLKIFQSSISEEDLKEIDNLIVNAMLELADLHTYLFNGEVMKIG